MSAIAKPEAKKYSTFREFYPFYLTEHSNRTCRRLHFAGSTLALICLVLLFATANPWWLATGVVAGYGFAWIGHFAFEKNRPASFKQPFYSFMGDWVMYKDIWTGRITF
jgi:hypothetical protein